MSQAPDPITRITRLSRKRVEEMADSMIEVADELKISALGNCRENFEDAAVVYRHCLKMMTEHGVDFIDRDCIDGIISFQVMSPSEMTGASKVEPRETRKPKSKLFSWMRRKGE